MGWCSGTKAFDSIVGELLISESVSEEDFDRIVHNVICDLEDMDWDCQTESDYWENPKVRKVFKEMYPDWFEDGDD